MNSGLATGGGGRVAAYCSAGLALATIAFALRVAGQAVQYWYPQPPLPPLADFQGSATPYWLLLPAQLVMLALMTRLTWRVHTGALVPRARAGRWLAAAGAAYMAVAFGRIVVGLAIATAPAWFRTWIPAALHVVLAAFVLILAQYHLRLAPRNR